MPWIHKSQLQGSPYLQQRGVATNSIPTDAGGTNINVPISRDDESIIQDLQHQDFAQSQPVGWSRYGDEYQVQGKPVGTTESARDAAIAAATAARKPVPLVQRFYSDPRVQQRTGLSQSAMFTKLVGQDPISYQKDISTQDSSGLRDSIQMGRYGMEEERLALAKAAAARAAAASNFSQDIQTSRMGFEKERLGMSRRTQQLNEGRYEMEQHREERSDYAAQMAAAMNLGKLHGYPIGAMRRNYDPARKAFVMPAITKPDPMDPTKTIIERPEQVIPASEQMLSTIDETLTGLGMPVRSPAEDMAEMEQLRKRKQMALAHRDAAMHARRIAGRRNSPVEQQFAAEYPQLSREQQVTDAPVSFGDRIVDAYRGGFIPEVDNYVPSTPRPFIPTAGAY